VERETGTAIDAHDWRAGFDFALADFGVQRLALYVTAHRLRARSYLERVAQCWAHLMMLAGTRKAAEAIAHEAA
jgi:hypothetical protein